jgi:hypothetical protein
MQIDPNHPTQRLLFYISDDVDNEADVLAMRDVVRQVAASRTWVIAPPVFLDDVEEDDEAGSLRTVGGFFELYSALPPWGDALPQEIDRAHLDEVKSVLHALAAFSRVTGHEIAFELDEEQIGWIENGVIDDSLGEGLLEEWQKSLM